MSNTSEIYDVIVVGAGLSGIAAAYHLQDKCPKKKIAILEARSAIGGTWDLFKYPGIRSDSDMYTLGFSFNLWDNPKSIADGPSILQYIKDTAKKFGIDKKIKFNHKIVDASWTDAEKIWTLTIDAHENTPEQKLQCKFLMSCSGYYDYDKGYDPDIKGSETFSGIIVHPQKWDTTINYENKKVIVIGSGATAFTLVPEMAKKAEKVIMLQRSPTYVVNLPSEDIVAKSFQKFLPGNITYSLVRWKNILLAIGFYNASRKWPNGIKKLLLKGVQKELGENYDMKNFEPSYKPWDQRICAIPDNDLFNVLKNGKAEVITDTINRFTSNGILLNSGRELEADIVVKATGLKVQLFGGIKVYVNGVLHDSGSLHAYRGAMLSDLPNFAFTVGYTNASWTLKCDLSCQYVTKVLNYMDAHNYNSCTPRFDTKKFKSEPLLDFDSGYVKRALASTPKQGSKHPWKVYQNYLRDLYALKIDSAADKNLEYS